MLPLTPNNGVQASAVGAAGGDAGLRPAIAYLARPPLACPSPPTPTHRLETCLVAS